MSNVIVKNNRYTVDPLYQWDLNQVLTIHGLSLEAIPEIHFTNTGMDRAIVKQAVMDDTGVINADVPNSLLQKPYPITAYVCMYEGETFESLYAIEIPVKARKKPGDYTLQSDEEVYSFNAMENQINNLASLIADHNDVDEELIQKYVTLGTKLENQYAATDAEINEKYNDLNLRVNTQLTEFSTDLDYLKNYVTPQMFGAVGDGEADDTAAIQTAINESTTVYIPPGTYKVSFNLLTDDNMNPAIVVPSNRVIRLAPNAVLTCTGVSLERYAFFRLYDVENVTIDGGKIVGERYGHTGNSGEWGMGISLSYARNIIIKNMEIRDCWGDGICFGTIDNDPDKVCQNLVIENVICDNNRRQGISACGVNGFYLNDCKLINTNGTAPQAGIDFESNAADIPQKHIFITNLYTENNTGYGVLICDKQEMELTIKNWVDVGSGSGGYPLHITTQAEYKKGFIFIENVILKETPLIGINYSHSANAFPVTIKNIRLDDVGINRADHPGGSLLLFVGNTSFNNQCGNLSITGIELNNLAVTSKDHVLLMNTYTDTTDNINNVFIEVDKINGLVSEWLKDLSLTTNFKINDKSEKIGYNHAVWDWTTVNTSIRYCVPSSSSVDRTFIIGDNMPVGLPFEIINDNPSGYGILLDCALPVLGYLTDNKAKYLKVKPICGAKVIMCRYDEDNFYITSGHEFLTTVDK